MKLLCNLSVPTAFPWHRREEIISHLSTCLRESFVKTESQFWFSLGWIPHPYLSLRVTLPGFNETGKPCRSLHYFLSSAPACKYSLRETRDISINSKCPRKWFNSKKSLCYPETVFFHSFPSCSPFVTSHIVTLELQAQSCKGEK